MAEQLLPPLRDDRPTPPKSLTPIRTCARRHLLQQTTSAAADTTTPHVGFLDHESNLHKAAAASLLLPRRRPSSKGHAPPFAHSNHCFSMIPPMPHCKPCSSGRNPSLAMKAVAPGGDLQDVNKRRAFHGQQHYHNLRQHRHNYEGCAVANRAHSNYCYSSCSPNAAAAGTTLFTMMPAAVVGKKKPPGYVSDEPASPEVTCMGRVRRSKQCKAWVDALILIQQQEEQLLHRRLQPSTAHAMSVLGTRAYASQAPLMHPSPLTSGTTDGRHPGGSAVSGGGGATCELQSQLKLLRFLRLAMPSSVPRPLFPTRPQPTADGAEAGLRRRAPRWNLTRVLGRVVNVGARRPAEVPVLGPSECPGCGEAVASTGEEGGAGRVKERRKKEEEEFLS